MQRDLSGNRIADVGGTRTYTYNNANRLAAVLDGGLTTATYVHNALGQRTKKTVGASDVIYLYDLAGKLLAEHDATGAMIRDYVWMNEAPVAQIDSGEAFRYLHFDHLNTPRLATDDAQTVVWRWDSDAFGTTLADEDPDGDLSATTVNLRFPGQYFDAETGFHYNYFRTYDPSTGRYVESDPIGWRGGLNSFNYTDQNPIARIDPLGLQTFPGPDASLLDRRQFVRDLVYRDTYAIAQKAMDAHDHAVKSIEDAKPTADEAADFFEELSEQSAYAGIACAIAGQPEGVILFGTMSAVSDAAVQYLRPNLSQTVRNAAVDALTSKMPPQVGGPVGIVTKEVLDHTEDQSSK